MEQEKDKIVLRLRFDDDWPVLDVSPNIKSCGYEPFEFLVQSLKFGAIFKPEEKHRLDQVIKEHSDAGEKSFTTNIEFYAKNGEILNMSAKISIIANDEVSMILTPLNKVSPEMGKEVLLKMDAPQVATSTEEKNTIQQYLDIIPVIVLALDPQGKIVNINKTGANILGGTPLDIIGKDWFANFLPPEIAIKMKPVFDTLIAGTYKPGMTYTHEVVCLNNSRKIILWRNSVTLDSQSRVATVLSAGLDVSERENMLKQLTITQKKFEMYIKEAPLAIFIIDGRGRYIEVNTAACSMLGYKHKEVLSMSIADLVVSTDVQKVLTAFQKLTYQGKIEGEFTFLRKDKSHLIGSLNAVKIDVNTYIAFVADITTQIKASEELQKRNREMQQLNTLMIDRELKMKELKAEINALKAAQLK